MEANFSLVGENDDLQDLFSKYGALALEKQENLSKLVGDNEPELEIEEGIVKFEDKEFPIQLLGFLDPDEYSWSWAWDNEEIGFPEELIREAKEVKEFGETNNIVQFKESMFAASFDEAHSGMVLQDVAKYFNEQWMDISANIASMFIGDMTPEDVLKAVDDGRAQLAKAAGDPNWQ